MDFLSSFYNIIIPSHAFHQDEFLLKALGLETSLELVSQVHLQITHLGTPPAPSQQFFSPISFHRRPPHLVIKLNSSRKVCISPEQNWTGSVSITSVIFTPGEKWSRL